MTEYVSKQVCINKPDTHIFQTLSSFSNFTAILQDKVENWTATEDSCSFRIKGIDLKLAIIDKQPCKVIKITGDKMPFEFFFWIQLVSVAERDTRMRLTLRANLNAMMKMMIGKKIERGVNEMAEQIAYAFNAQP